MEDSSCSFEDESDSSDNENNVHKPVVAISSVRDSISVHTNIFDIKRQTIEPLKIARRFYTDKQ